MSDSSVDRALGALDGRVTALERWTGGLDSKLEDAADANHEMATQVALMRQSLDQLGKVVAPLTAMHAEITEMKGAGKLALGIAFAVGGLAGTIAASIGAAWIKKLFGWE